MSEITIQARSEVAKCGFPLAKERMEQKMFFLTHTGSVGLVRRPRAHSKFSLFCTRLSCFFELSLLFEWSCSSVLIVSSLGVLFAI